MALPDLLIAYHVTGKPRYIEEYRKVIARFGDNPEPSRDTGPYSLERVARVNHSSEGQAYEALFHILAYEKDPKLLAQYRRWMDDLWEMNWMEGNSLFTYMTLAFEKTPSHGKEALELANDTLRRYPVDRVLRPVMNSIRADMEINPNLDRGKQKQAAKPIPIDERPLDNEYAWKGNPYQMDGWLCRPSGHWSFPATIPMAWFSDATGRIYLTRDGMKSWQDVSWGLEGRARAEHIRVSDRRTYVLHADTDHGIMLTRDGGMSWRTAPQAENVQFPARDFSEWHKHAGATFRIGDKGELRAARARVKRHQR